MLSICLPIIVYFKYIIQFHNPRMIQCFVNIVLPQGMSENKQAIILYKLHKQHARNICKDIWETGIKVIPTWYSWLSYHPSILCWVGVFYKQHNAALSGRIPCKLHWSHLYQVMLTTNTSHSGQGDYWTWNTSHMIILTWNNQKHEEKEIFGSEFVWLISVSQRGK